MEEYPSDKDNPLIIISGIVPSFATTADGVTVIRSTLGVPVDLAPPSALMAVLLVNKPFGNVIVIVFDVVNAPVDETFNMIFKSPDAAPAPDVVQVAFPAIRAIDGTHFLESLSHIVPTSQHPGP